MVTEHWSRFFMYKPSSQQTQQWYVIFQGLQSGRIPANRFGHDRRICELAPRSVPSVRTLYHHSCRALPRRYESIRLCHHGWLLSRSWIASVPVTPTTSLNTQETNHPLDYSDHSKIFLVFDCGHGTQHRHSREPQVFSSIAKPFSWDRLSYYSSWWQQRPWSPNRHKLLRSCDEFALQVSLEGTPGGNKYMRLRVQRRWGASCPRNRHCRKSQLRDSADSTKILICPLSKNIKIIIKKYWARAGDSQLISTSSEGFALLLLEVERSWCGLFSDWQYLKRWQYPCHRRRDGVWALFTWAPFSDFPIFAPLHTFFGNFFSKNEIYDPDLIHGGLFRSFTQWEEWVWN